MGRNYEAIHYIREQLKGFDSKFVECAVRCFNFDNDSQSGDNCLVDTVSLYVCAKKFGYKPQLCYGLCKLGEREFYHAWLEINDTIIDVAIYGNVHHSPFFPEWKTKVKTPYIGKYKDSFLYYGKYEFDEHWKYCSISKAEGQSIIDYIKFAPGNGMWKLICNILDITPTKQAAEQLSSYIQDEYIQVK